MMPIPLAIAWYYWRQHRIFVLAFWIYLIALVILANTVARGRGFADMAGFTIPLMFAGLYLLAIFAHAQADLASTASGFPAHLFLLPVSSAQLALWPMLLGGGMLAVAWIAIAQFIVAPTGAHVPIGWPAAMLAALLAWLQVLVWSPIGLTFARIPICIAALGSLIALGFLAAAFDCPPSMLLLSYLLFILLAYAAAYIGLRRARSGAAPNWQRPIERFLSSFNTGFSAQPFSSAAQAQLWYEIRSSGLIMPLLVAGAAVALAIPGIWIHEPVSLGVGGIQVNLWTRSQFILLLLPLLFAQFAGGAIARRTSRGFDLLMATRPITSNAFVAAKLRAAAVTTLLSWAVALMALALWMLAPAHSPGQSGPLGYLLYQHLSAGRICLLACTLGVAIFLTWAARAQWLWIQLIDRRWISDGVTLLIPCVLLTLFCSAGIAWRMPQSANIMALPYRLLVVAVLLKLICAFLVLRAAHRRRILSRQFIQLLLWGWLEFAAVLYFLLDLGVPSTLIRPTTLAFLVIVLIPLSRLVAAPLALASSRHR